MQRELVDRAKRGDHDALSSPRDPCAVGGGLRRDVELVVDKPRARAADLRSRAARASSWSGHTPTMTEHISWRRFRESEGVEDWRNLSDGACAMFRTGSFAESVRFVAAMGELYVFRLF